MNNINNALAAFRKKHPEQEITNMKSFILGYHACMEFIESNSTDKAYAISIAAEDTAHADYDADYENKFIRD